MNGLGDGQLHLTDAALYVADNLGDWCRGKSYRVFPSIAASRAM
jgi:hypothetical protein